MTIYYLYVKTHKITGLKYLGQTSASDPHRYPGSGVDWKVHLKEYGYNYTTEILRECQDKNERREWGLYYSNLWNVVDSEAWANRIPETGGFGIRSPETIAKWKETRIQNDSFRRSLKSIAKHLETKKKNGTISSISPESIAKALATKKKNGTLNNSSPESIAKGIETKKKSGTLNTTTAESVDKIKETKKKNGTLNAPHSPEHIAKGIETRRKNGTLSVSHKTHKSPGPRPPEITAKIIETRKRNKLLRS